MALFQGSTGVASIRGSTRAGVIGEREFTVCVLFLVVPDSVVVGCLGNEHGKVKPGELALRLHFEAEHSNVMIVTAELLNGCLTRCEVLAMKMVLQTNEKVSAHGMEPGYPLYNGTWTPTM